MFVLPLDADRALSARAPRRGGGAGARSRGAERLTSARAANGTTRLDPAPKPAPTRVGITVTKKVGSAVDRNRIKRVVREVFRRHRSFFPDGFDYVFIAKRGLAPVGLEDLAKEMRGARQAIARATKKAAKQAESAEAPKK